jgi:hypothetical protein
MSRMDSLCRDCAALRARVIRIFDKGIAVTIDEWGTPENAQGLRDMRDEIFSQPVPANSGNSRQTLASTS